MEVSDREECEKILAEIFAAIDKPLGDAQREAFWRGLKQMSLVEFSRCRDKIIGDLREGEIPRRFGVSDIWVAKSKLQAAAPTQPREDGFPGDKWDEAANIHLLRHITTLLAENSRRYGRPASVRTMQDPDHAHLANCDADPRFVRNVHILVAHKNRWADMMRSLDPGTGEGVDTGEQQEIWAECMRRAEEEIASA